MDSGVWFLVVLIFPSSGDGLIMGGSRPYPSEQACLDAKADALKYDPLWRNAQHYIVARCMPKPL
jgi:hypothetical protein